MFGTVNAVEVHKNGFGGITPLNTTGLTVFNDSLKRSFDYESDSLVLSAEFSILETNGDIKDFSLFDNDLTPNGNPNFVDSDFRTGLETDGSTQWGFASISTDSINHYDNVSMVWWGQVRETNNQSIAGKACTGGSTSYLWGIYINQNNNLSAKMTSSCTPDLWIETTFTLAENITYAIGVVFENINQTEGTNVHFWVNGDWIYSETITQYMFQTNANFYVGRGLQGSGARYCNCIHDELLIFRERLDNQTMKLLTTKQHDIVIKSGPRTTTQGFEGLFFALPWLIVFSLIGWIFYLIAISWKEIFTKE